MLNYIHVQLQCTARDTTAVLGVFDVSSSWKAIVLTGAVLYGVSSSWTVIVLTFFTVETLIYKAVSNPGYVV